jgi:hypothetical protein
MQQAHGLSSQGALALNRSFTCSIEVAEDICAGLYMAGEGRGCNWSGRSQELKTQS